MRRMYSVDVHFSRSIRGGLGRYNTLFVPATSEAEARRTALDTCQARYPGNKATIVRVEDESAPAYTPLYR